MKEGQYKDIVNWYNRILDRASQARERAGDLSKEAAINEVLSNSLISLRKSVNPFYVLDEATKSEIVNISHRMNSEGVDKFRRKGKKGELVHNLIQGIKGMLGNKSPSAFFETQFIAASKLGPVDTTLPEDLIVSSTPAVARVVVQVGRADSVKDRMQRLAAAAGNPAARLKILDLQMSPEEAAAVRDLEQGGDGKGLSKASQGAWNQKRVEENERR